MTLEWRSVYSSNVESVGHDPDSNELYVKWSDGKVSVYEGVSPDKFQSVASAWSVGKAIHSQVKPFHQHRYG